MADYPNIWAALYSKLAGTSAVTTIVSTRIYDRFVPLGTAAPFVVFYHTAGGPENQVPREMLNEVFRVESVSSQHYEVIQLFQAVYAALHKQALTISGWTNWWLAVEDIVTLTDTRDGQQIYRWIIDIRIRASDS